MLLIVDFPSRSVIIRYFTFLFSITISPLFLIDLLQYCNLSFIIDKLLPTVSLLWAYQPGWEGSGPTYIVG
jgi:hypothetical protein